MAKIGRWVAREMGGEVGSVPAFYGSSLVLNPDFSQNYKMATEATHSSRPKNIQKSLKSYGIPFN